MMSDNHTDIHMDSVPMGLLDMGTGVTEKSITRATEAEQPQGNTKKKLQTENDYKETQNNST